MGEDREVEGAGAQGTGQGRCGALAQRDGQPGRQCSERSGQEAGGRCRERPESYRPGRGRLAGEFAMGGVEFVEDADRCCQQPSARWGKDDTAAAAIEQSAPGGSLERRRLSRDSRLGLAEGVRRG